MIGRSNHNELRFPVRSTTSTSPTSAPPTPRNRRLVAESFPVLARKRIKRKRQGEKRFRFDITLQSDERHYRFPFPPVLLIHSLDHRYYSRDPL